MNKLSINELIALAETSNVPFVTSTGANKCSFCIVNNINGKRLSFSKMLSQKLELSTEVFLLPLPSQGKILLANTPISPKASVGTLSGVDKKICYSAQLVKGVSAAFQLDFSEKTSIAFSDIEFDTVNGTTVAIVNISNGDGEEQNDEADPDHIA